MDPELTDFVAEQAKERPTVRATIKEARLYDSLRENEAWQALAKRVRDDRARYMSGLAGRMMAGNKVSDEEIAYMRGFYFGARWIIEHPEEAEKSLERAARAAWRMVLLEEAAQAEESSPYIDKNSKEE